MTRLAKGEVMCGRCGDPYQSSTHHDCPASALTDVNPPLVSSMYISGYADELLDVHEYSCRTCQRKMYCSYPDVPQHCPFCEEEPMSEARASITPHSFVSTPNNGPCSSCGHLRSHKLHEQFR
jgi:hypothetical protein